MGEGFMTGATAPESGHRTPTGSRPPFKVLFIYPNMMMMMLAPTGIAILTAVLRRAGIAVELFDTTLYRTEGESSDERKVSNLQIRPFNLAERGVVSRTSNMIEDLMGMLENYRPDLIAFSVVEDTWSQTCDLLNAISGWKRERGVPAIVGGVFPTFAADIVMGHRDVDYACVGEGEGALPELCERLRRKEDTTRIPNLWTRQNGGVVQNQMRPTVELDELPPPDFSVFEPQRLYRPMGGKVYRMLPVETHRGCPYKCTFCNSPATQQKYRGETDKLFFRMRSIEKTMEEIRYLVDRWRLEYLYFSADTFLAMSDADLRKFADLYVPIGLPFWMQTRPETFSAERIRLLEKMGIERCSMGLEHGDEAFRKNVLKRPYGNDRAIQVFRLLENSTIPVTINNIIGFPGETRELAFETIRLNRHFNADTVNCYTFVPYHGTSLREICLREGYLDASAKTCSLTKETILRMPQFPPEQIKGLLRTFCMYVKFPEDRWSDIEPAEAFDDEGDAAFQKLRGEFLGRFLSESVRHAA